jgi:hypothetical protein
VRAVLRTQRARRGTGQPDPMTLLPKALGILSRIGNPVS